MADAGASLPLATPRIVIAPRGTGLLSELRELVRFRELLAFLAWRDIRVRYRQTILGAAWALIEPFVNVILFTLVFNRLAGIESGAVPYPLYTFAAVLLWTYFSRALRATTVSLVSNSGLVTKAYFPRLALPLAAQLATTADFACALVMYFVLVLYYGVLPPIAALTVPLWVALASINALGIGLVLAAINVRFRDVSQAVPFMTQAWMFLTPIAYPLHAIPERWQALYGLNPMVGVVEGMRWALLPGHTFDPLLLVPSIVMGIVMLLIGVASFRAMQRRFADIV
jgi:lipopolysaccharide transport system permease protein